MTVTIANTVPSSGHTFEYLINRLNECADALSTKAVTTGNTVVGNVAVSGFIASNTLVANTIRGGTLSVANTLNMGSNLNIGTYTLIVGNSTSNVVITGNSVTFSNASLVIDTINTDTINTGSLSVGNSTSNVVVAQTGITINTVSVVTTTYLVSTNTSGTSAQLVDSFAFGSFRGAEHVLVIKDSGANSVQMTKTLVVCDGGESYLTEYGVVESNANLGVLSANANSTHVRLYLTPTVSAASVRGQRVIVVV